MVEENGELFFSPVNHMKRLPSLERSAAPIIKSLLASQGEAAPGVKRDHADCWSEISGRKSHTGATSAKVQTQTRGRNSTFQG